jgi:ribonuclease BN (tRNA processing enzyme)
MTTTHTHTDHSADLDAFLPLVASAWKEGELSDLELAAVCLEIIRDPKLDLSCRDTLRQWLDSSDGQATLESSKLSASASL